jgi:hypothetical protein
MKDLYLSTIYSFISIPFKLEGPMGNLKVTPLPPAAVGEGLVGIMKRTLQLPVDIIQPSFPRRRRNRTNLDGVVKSHEFNHTAHSAVWALTI